MQVLRVASLFLGAAPRQVVLHHRPTEPFQGPRAGSGVFEVVRGSPVQPNLVRCSSHGLHVLARSLTQKPVAGSENIRTRWCWGGVWIGSGVPCGTAKRTFNEARAVRQALKGLRRSSRSGTCLTCRRHHHHRSNRSGTCLICRRRRSRGGPAHRGLVLLCRAATRSPTRTCLTLRSAACCAYT